MRKIMNIFAAALVMMAAASCEKNEVLPDNNSEGKVVTLKASINNGETKVSLGEKSGETYPVLWSEGDEIAVAQFVGSDVRVYKFTLTAGEGTPNGTFTCEDATGFDPLSEATVALYPYTAQLDFLVVQTNQNYAEKSFDSDAILMMASMEDGSLKFNNILGILKLTIKGASDETVRSIELTADKPISGNAKFFDTGEGPYIVTDGPDADYKNNIVLNCPDVAIDTEKEFLITVPAGTYDFAVTINTNKGTYYKSTANKEILNSVILKMPALDLTDDFKNSMPYVENGVYLGEGVALPAGEGKTIIWAPVNCGYEPVDGSYKGYPYGKLYQWGRKYGQGYKDENYVDATYPSGENWVKTEPVEMSAGQSAENKDKFFYKWLETPPANNLWNKGTEESPAKTEYDPCPEGWRVPTETEFFTLVNTVTSNYILNISPEQVDSENKGVWFYGKTNETTGSKVFFPFAGSVFGDEEMINRGNTGIYWSSSYDFTDGGIALMKSMAQIDNPGTFYMGYSDGFSVRCVKE